MPLHVLHAHFLASIWITTVWARESIHTVLSQLGCYYGMCISIFFFGSFFFFFVFVGCTDYQALGHKGLLDTQTSFIMQILYLSRLVLVQLAFKFKSCRFLFTKNADKVCMFCFLILPSVFVFYCICNIRSFSKRRTDSKENYFFFLNLTKIASSVDCSRIGWNSYPRIRLCADLMSA